MGGGGSCPPVADASDVVRCSALRPAADGIIERDLFEASVDGFVEGGSGLACSEPYRRPEASLSPGATSELMVEPETSDPVLGVANGTPPGPAFNTGLMGEKCYVVRSVH